jgi:hypothetical protein
MAFKRSSRKTGPNSRETTTISTNGGTTRSTSTKNSTGSRRTTSFNSSTGKVKETWTTKNGGGYTSVKTKTLNPVKKVRPSKGRVTKPFNLFGGRKRRKKEIDYDIGDFGPPLLPWWVLIPFLPILLPLKLLGPIYGTGAILLGILYFLS